MVEDAGAPLGPRASAPTERIGTKVLLLIPVFNDWTAAALLLGMLDEVLSRSALDAHVVFVDDGSTILPSSVTFPKVTSLRGVSILGLRRNLGHQRAIAIGLAWAHDHSDSETVVIMDGDGEDDPRDVPRLVEKVREFEGRKIVFAERARRSEGLVFKIFYRIFQVIALLSTGQGIRVGNFSAVPRGALERIVVISEAWNHYAAAVFNGRIEYDMIPTTRARRLDGRPQMNFTSLVVHGLSALSVYSSVIGVRLLFATGTLILLTVAAIALLGVVKVTGVMPLPSWVPYATAVLLMLLFQAVSAAVLFVFVMLAGRQGASMIPLRDYAHFIARVTRAPASP
jgi:hypothetical protein